MVRAASIYEVARRAGVSHTTASNVLNRPGLRRHASTTTAERVRQIATQLGYVPHSAAQSLSRGKTHTIALTTDNSLRFAYVNEMVEELETALTPTGYHLNLELLYRAPSEDAVYRALAPGRCDGVISFSVRRSAGEQLRAIRRRGLPVVAIDMEQDPALDSVFHDGAEAARLGMAHLLERGHRRIAFVVDQPDDLSRQTRLRGYAAALATAGLGVDNALLFPWLSWDAPQELWQRIAAVQPAPTALLCYNPELTMTLLMELRRQGVRVPEAMAVVALGDHFMLRLFDVPVTTVDSNHRQVAQTAVERLLAQFNDPLATPQQILVQPSLVIRKSS